MGIFVTLLRENPAILKLLKQRVTHHELRVQNPPYSTENNYCPPSSAITLLQDCAKVKSVFPDTLDDGLHLLTAEVDSTRVQAKATLVQANTENLSSNIKSFHEG